MNLGSGIVLDIIVVHTPVFNDLRYEKKGSL